MVQINEKKLIELIKESISKNLNYLGQIDDVLIQKTKKPHVLERMKEYNLSLNDVFETISLALPELKKRLMNSINDFGTIKQIYQIVNQKNCMFIALKIEESNIDNYNYIITLKTAYIWDGRSPIGSDYTIYVNEPSELFLKTKKFSEEHALEWANDGGNLNSRKDLMIFAKTNFDEHGMPLSKKAEMKYNESQRLRNFVYKLTGRKPEI